MKWLVLSFFGGVILTIIVGLFIVSHFQPIKNVVQTNEVYGEKVSYLTNIYRLTNYITNYTALTNIETIFADYDAFYSNSFVFVQSNDTMNVRLYRRSASTKLLPWFSSHKNIVSVLYPLGIQYQRQILSFPIADILIGGGYSFTNSIYLLIGVDF